MHGGKCGFCRSLKEKVLSFCDFFKFPKLIFWRRVGFVASVLSLEVSSTVWRVPVDEYQDEKLFPGQFPKDFLLSSKNILRTIDACNFFLCAKKRFHENACRTSC